MEDWGSAEFPVSIMSFFQGDVTSCCSEQAHQQGKMTEHLIFLLFKEYLRLYSL